MKQFVLVFAFLGLAFAAPSLHHLGEEININEWKRNGTNSYHSTTGARIVGGNLTTIDKFPWQVAILRNSEQVCGGAIVAARAVLTAAHCVAPSEISSIADLNIRSGSTYNNTGGLRVAASKIIIHELYVDCSTCVSDYDIAVVLLAADAVASGITAAAVPLWKATTVFSVGTMGTVTGWGATSEGGDGSVQLRRVDVPVVSEDSCQTAYGSVITNRTICAGYADGGKDSCQGDSGGPYVIKKRLAGLVNFGNGCARAGFPGVYSSIPGHRDWIKANAGV